jgi:predicted DNA-binding transcriptional regulator YafY
MLKIIKRLQRIDELIRIKGTGAPANLARRLGVSERSLYEYLRLMKEFGAPIHYSRTAQTYHYGNEGKFLISFVQ